MAKIVPGRHSAQIDGPFVVFMIGMRVNNVLAVRKWLPTGRAMGQMLATLYRDKEKGFLGGESFIYWRGVAMLQYWRSFEELEHFARNAADPHLPAWRWYNRAVAGGEDVGIWHETYKVEPGQYEAIYGNMPVFGLASAASHVPAVGKRETARRRMGGTNEPAVPAEA